MHVLQVEKGQHVCVSAKRRTARAAEEACSGVICYEMAYAGRVMTALLPLLCLCAAAAVVSEDAIHAVPFQFDLIQLLPKCQQVELFFLTFGTGTAPVTDQAVQTCRVTLSCFFFFEALQPEEQLPSASGLPNELLLSLLHHSLEHELNDREIPLAYSDHGAFMLHILERERDGNVAPFSLPVIKGQHISQPLRGRLSHVCRLSVSTEECAKPADRQDTMTSFHTSCSSKEVMGSTSTLQVTTPSFKTKQTLATSLRQSSQQQSMKNFYGSRFEIPTLTTDFSNGRALATRILWTRSPSLGREAALFHSGGATLSSSAASRFSSLFSQRPSQVRSAVCVRPPSAQV